RGYIDLAWSAAAFAYFLSNRQCCHFSLLSASQHVNDRKNDDPHHIDKMPVQGKHFDTMGLFPSDPAGKREDRDHDEHDHSCRDVECVQTDERVIGCPEEVGGDRQPVLVDQPVPFLSGPEKKQTTQQNREGPQAKECAAFALLEEFPSIVNGQAAGEQADRKENRSFEYFARSGSGQALAYIKEVG